MPDSDNRRSRRVSVDGVTGSVMFSHDIHIQNISLDGVAFRTTKRLQINKVYLLKIPCGDNHVPIRGEVVWCTLSGSVKNDEGGVAPLYSLGMQFIAGQQDRLNALEGFIERRERQDSLFRDIRAGVTLSPGTDHELSLPDLYTAVRLTHHDLVLEADTEFALDARAQLEIHLPGEKVAYPVGRVTREETTAEGHRVTIEFTKITEQDEAAILRALGSL